MYINYNDKLANLKAEIDMNMVPNIPVSYSHLTLPTILLV